MNIELLRIFWMSLTVISYSGGWRRPAGAMVWTSSSPARSAKAAVQLVEATTMDSEDGPDSLAPWEKAGVADRARKSRGRNIFLSMLVDNSFSTCCEGTKAVGTKI